MKITVTAGPWPDWKTERERIDLAAVATRLLGPAPGRRGERGRRLWWPCPFHEDRNPSFCVEPGKGWWRCFGCGANGDAANLVMRLQGVGFPEAVAILTGRSAPLRKPLTRPVTTPKPKPPPDPSGMPEADALALVEDSVARLWSPEGALARAYLTGPRCLDLETIRAARLGLTPGASDSEAHDGDGSFKRPRGGHPVVQWGPPGAGQDPPARRMADEIRRSVPRPCPPRLLSSSPAKIFPGRPLVVVEGGV